MGTRKSSNTPKRSAAQRLSQQYLAVVTGRAFCAETQRKRAFNHPSAQTVAANRGDCIC